MSERSSYRFDRFVVEPHTARLLRDGESVTLEPKSFSVLLFLLEHRDRLVDKQELLDGVWSDTVVTENALTRAVARLRKALADDPREPRFVATVHTRGYRFVAPVDAIAPHREEQDPNEPETRPRSWLSSPVARLGLALGSALVLTAAIARVYTGRPQPSRPAAAGEIEGLRSAAQGPTRNVTAYEHYLRGRAFHRQLTQVGNENAIELYQKALELDPDFALAHAGLAYAYGIRIVHFGFDPDDGSAQALAEARRALELDPELPEAYQAIGIVEYRRSRVRSALDYTLKALELDPDYDEAIFNASLIHHALGRWDESLFFALRDSKPPPLRLANYAMRLWELRFYDLAQELIDVVSNKEPLKLVLGIHQLIRLMSDGDLRAARARAERLIEAHRDVRELHRSAGEIEWRAGDRDKALEHFENAVLLQGSPLDSELRAATIRWLRDRDPQAGATLDRLAAEAKKELENGSEWERDYWTVAAVEASRGTPDEAVRWYASAVDAGRRVYFRDEGDPLFASLRDDPRFIAQLDRMRADVARMKDNVLQEVGPDLGTAVRRAWASAP